LFEFIPSHKSTTILVLGEISFRTFFAASKLTICLKVGMAFLQ